MTTPEAAGAGAGSADAVGRALERAHREHRGRLVAYLASRFRDVTAAEDAVADATRRALEVWPERGVPAEPAAWLLTAARRRLLNRRRHDDVAQAAAPAVRSVAAELAEPASTPGGASASAVPDRRLELLFVCAHPSLDPAVQTPLMLQTVLGLDAARIASAFLISPAALGQRLVRAKAKIRDAGIPFSVPGRAEFPGRLVAVMEAIYAAYGTGWEDVDGIDAKRRGLAEEAIWLARVLVEVLPRAPEPKGLLALMLYCQSRRAARRGADGAYVPLSEQDPSRWDASQLAEAERWLKAAAAAAEPGRFQLEAMVQSIHVDGARTGGTRWPLVVAAYDELLRRHPTPGAAVSRAAALLHAGGPGSALEALDALCSARASMSEYQPYWAVRAGALEGAGRFAEARGAYDRAMGLCEHPRVRDFLGRKRAAAAAKADAPGERR